MCINNPVPMKARWIVAYKVVYVINGVYRSEFAGTKVRDGKPDLPAIDAFRDPYLVGKWSAFKKLEDARWWASLGRGQVILKVRLKGNLIIGEIPSHDRAHVAGESIKILREVT